MVGLVTLASICAVAIAFYLRFLVALCSEYRFVRICYLACIQPAVVEGVVVEMGHEDEILGRAA